VPSVHEPFAPVTRRQLAVGHRPTFQIECSDEAEPPGRQARTKHDEGLHQLELGQRVTPGDRVRIKPGEDGLCAHVAGNCLRACNAPREQQSNENQEKQAVRPAGGHVQETNEAGAL
jgi:hypothetical protein